MFLSRSYRCLLSVLLCIFKNLDINIMKRESVDDAAALRLSAGYVLNLWLFSFEMYNSQSHRLSKTKDSFRNNLIINTF
jgi:hypothetical protein